MQSRLLLDVVVRKRASVLELLAGKNQTLLVGRDTLSARGQFEEAQRHVACAPFLVLNFLLNVVDGIRGLNLEGDGLPREGFDEDLHLRRFLRPSFTADDQQRLTLNLVVVVARRSSTKTAQFRNNVW